MESGVPGRLAGWEIHGFCTMEDLDIGRILKEARERWLRPNEIHAILCNYKYFTVSVKPVDSPKGGTLVLFDRKVLRNFRKDGHCWNKKRDGKTVKEAHEHLKVGDQDRIHVYYARGEGNANFFRRIYWLLDKKHEHIVLVHYREILEESVTQSVTTLRGCKETLSVTNQQASPFTSVQSTSVSTSKVLSEEADSGLDCAFFDGFGASVFTESAENVNCLDENLIMRSHEQKLHEINTLDWADLVDTCNSPFSTDTRSDGTPCSKQENENHISDGVMHENYAGLSYLHGSFENPVSRIATTGFSNRNSSLPETYVRNIQGKDTKMIASKSNVIMDFFSHTAFDNEACSVRQMTCSLNDMPGSIDAPGLEFLLTADRKIGLKPSHQLFNITDISPTWAFSTEETKVLVVGYFYEAYAQLARSNLCCLFGDKKVPVNMVQPGVFRCTTLPSAPAVVELYLSLDGETPISQILRFEYRSSLTNKTDDELASLETKRPAWEEFHQQTRLAHLLFSISSNTSMLSDKISQRTIPEARKFACFVLPYGKEWMTFLKAVENKQVQFSQARRNLFELCLKSKLREWLLEKILDGCRIIAYDHMGQGVIHLCAMLGYEWAVFPFSCSSFSLDSRDAFGWTALHWAAFYGRETMVAFLLSAGANPSYVTDPTPKCPGGYTAADLACLRGYNGLAAYLAEKSLAAHFRAMAISGNISGSLQVNEPVLVKPENVDDGELCLKDSLAAICRAAEAAARIQAAFKEQKLRLKTKAAQLEKTEHEAAQLIAALKIQHVFRTYHERKRMAAAAQIQYRFRTWRRRKEFLKLRRHAIRIQAVFRGHLIRKQYKRILWSVGVLEKAILRWRMKRKGLRGFHVKENAGKLGLEETSGMEDFYVISQKQAEERVERSVVRVQAMFRSHQAQKEYRRMKLAFNQAKVEYDGLLIPSHDHKGIHESSC